MPGKKAAQARWRVFEKLAASMYSSPGVKVERNVRLPVRHSQGQKNRTREIDVLLTGHIAGVLIRIPIECKDYGAPVGVPKIGEFVDKLADVGLPPAPSVVGAAHGFTQDALDRAAEVGMVTRVLKEVSKESMASAVNSALQRIVYLLAMIDTVTLQDNVARHADVQDAISFQDSEGRFRGTILDLVWQRWRAGQPPSQIGEHELALEVPEGWHRFVDGKEEPILSAAVTLKVVGLVAHLAGTATQHVLVDPSTGAEERRHLSAVFDGDSYAVRVATSEEELIRAGDDAGVRITVGRFRLPRIFVNFMYWPPSAKTWQKMNELAASMPKEQFLKLPLTVHNIEETPLAAAWDPIIDGWPVPESA